MTAAGPHAVSNTRSNTGPNTGSNTGANTGSNSGSNSGPHGGGLPLVVEGAVKAFGDTVAVAGVSLALDAEEIVSVVGPSGCGKSTLLRLIGGLERLHRGSIRLGGTLVDDGTSQLPPERRSVGLVFQEHALFPHLTVRDNVAFGLRGWSRRAVNERVDEMLAVVSLGGYGSRFPHELSGGERQRVALARALAPSPALMLLDEPFASLDRNLRDDLRHQVLAALRATGTAALMVTHDQHEALSMGDRIAVMRSGRIVQVASPSAVFHTPVNRFTAAFMGDASFLPIDVSDGVARTALGVVAPSATDSEPSGAGPTGVAMVRPDDVAYVPAGPDAEAPTGSPVQVVDREYRGTHWMVTVELEDGTTVLATASHLVEPLEGQRGAVSLVPGHRQVPLPADDRL